VHRREVPKIDDAVDRARHARRVLVEDALERVDHGLVLRMPLLRHVRRREGAADETRAIEVLDVVERERLEAPAEEARDRLVVDVPMIDGLVIDRVLAQRGLVSL
jgi:hypothetical protein